MPGRTTKSPSDKARDQMLTFETLAVLDESIVALTISEIQERSMTLTGLTSQKMARILSELNKAGLVRKAQSKSRKRMVYMSVAKMEELGITIAEEVN